MIEKINKIVSKAPLCFNMINDNGKYLVWTNYNDTEESYEFSADGETPEEALDKIYDLVVAREIELAE